MSGRKKWMLNAVRLAAVLDRLSRRRSLSDAESRLLERALHVIEGKTIRTTTYGVTKERARLGIKR